MHRYHRLRADFNWLNDAGETDLGAGAVPDRAAPLSWRLGASMCVAVVMTAAAFAAPAYMTGLNPMNLAMPLQDGLDGQSMRQLAFEDGEFLIEPAAGPIGQDQIAACRAILADELQGDAE
ncbi:MAG: hypothetical protein R3F54_06245 [Alphaproteobacteria bacterium]